MDDAAAVLIDHGGCGDQPVSQNGAGGLERETGIEPATNSLEGCDSTIELLPRSA